MLKVFTLLVSFTALSFAYDFKDAAFNDYLIEELKDATNPIAATFRFKRDVDVEGDKCFQHYHNKMQCCKAEITDPKKFEAFKIAKSECCTEINGDDELNLDPFDCEATKTLKEKVLCVGECISRKFGILQENGNLDRDKAVAHFKIKYADTPWRLEKIEEVVDKCLTYATKEVENEKNKCNPQTIKMIHCLWKDFVQNCPADMQIKSKKCNRIRDKIEKNDEAYLKRLHFNNIVEIFHEN